MTEISQMKVRCLESFSAIEESIQQVAERFQVTRSEAGQLQQELRGWREQVDRLKSEIGLRDATIARLEKDLQWREHQLAEASRTAPGADASETIKKPPKDLKQLQETVAQLEEVLRVKERYIEQLEGARRPAPYAPAGSVASAQIEELQAAVAAKDLDLERMQRALESKQDHIHRLYQEREAIRERIAKIIRML